MVLGKALLFLIALLVPSFSGAFPSIKLQKIADHFDKPLYLTHAGDGSGRIFVVEQDGVIRVLKKGEKGPGRIFFDIRDRVKSGGEMGLLGLAFHPNFKQSGRLFINYTTEKEKLWTHISEFKANPKEDQADAKSEKILLKFEQPYDNHNGGMIAFGPDGFLYVGTGDGGAGHDPNNNGQSLETLLGKILRIDIDKYTKQNPYFIPIDNPFRHQHPKRPEIFAYGLRNPWRFSFDRGTGKLYVGDVGQSDREEIDLIERGKNYGWRVMEGRICTPKIKGPCDPKKYTAPLLDYPRSDGISVTGGYVYRGKQFSPLQGIYFYGDYGSGKVWGLQSGNEKAESKILMETGLMIASFGEDEAGELYLIDHRGTVYQIVQ